MATLGGTGLINSNLVFGYDMGNNRFFPGEPTTNLLSGEANNTPKVGNGWGTYNTNQYNGATYFSIGTISSITSNIVTTSGNHPLRSYDVVTPQTTGGGLTAGTNYLIKKLSNTTFSIHSYNSSQDGSQGYINTSTGTFKVYDDFANDVRVSINATSFPTMWWGPPHLPNSGLVKEIITNGFTNPLTGQKSDCIRQHVHRADGVADHMAYGVDAGFTPNQTVCCSFWARAVDGGAVGKSINYYHYTYGQTSATAYSMNAVLGAVGEWKRYSYTFTSPNSVAISYWFNPGGPYKYDIANIQIEQKNRPTPYTPSSRSSTSSLLDKKRTKTISISDLTFNDSGLAYFDGVNDTIDTGYALTSFPALSNFSFECIVKITSYPTAAPANGYNNTTRYGVIVGATYYCGAAIYWNGNSSGNVCTIYSYIRGADAYRNTSTFNLSLNTFYHLVLVNDYTNSKLKLFINGSLYSEVATATQEYNSGLTSSAGNIGISKAQVDGGGEGNYSYFPGQIPVTRLYNKALSTSEVFQNYKGFQRRFSLP